MVLSLILVGCNNNQPEPTAPVTVHVDGFSISQEDFPSSPQAPARAAAEVKPAAEYNGIKALTLAFYDGNTEVYKATQLKDDATTYTTFGEFSLALPMGSYTMVVLGYVLYDDDELTLTSPSQAEYTGGYPRETFAATQEVNITNTSAVELTATLNRIIACLQVISTDGRTANVSKVRMTFSAGGKAFDPTTGLATVNTGSVSTVGVSATVGTTSTSTGFVFLYTDDQTMDVTIETLDAEGNTIYTKTVNEVPFQRNRKTKLTGAIYTNNGVSCSFLVNTSWLDEEDPISF